MVIACKFSAYYKQEFQYQFIPMQNCTFCFTLKLVQAVRCNWFTGISGHVTKWNLYTLMCDGKYLAARHFSKINSDNSVAYSIFFHDSSGPCCSTYYIMNDPIWIHWREQTYREPNFNRTPWLFRPLVLFNCSSRTWLSPCCGFMGFNGISMKSWDWDMKSLWYRY